MQLLLEGRSNVDACGNEGGHTPLQVALEAHGSSDQVVRLLKVHEYIQAMLKVLCHVKIVHQLHVRFPREYIKTQGNTVGFNLTWPTSN